MWGLNEHQKALNYKTRVPLNSYYSRHKQRRSDTWCEYSVRGTAVLWELAALVSLVPFVVYMDRISRCNQVGVWPLVRWPEGPITAVGGGSGPFGLVMYQAADLMRVVPSWLWRGWAEDQHLQIWGLGPQLVKGWSAQWGSGGKSTPSRGVPVSPGLKLSAVVINLSVYLQKRIRSWIRYKGGWRVPER